jgi:hypothetical protein
MSLQTILDEINSVKALAEEDTNSGPTNTLIARRGRKAQAVEQLKRLKRDYRQQLIQNTVFIIATGSGRDEFTKLAKEEFGLFSADPEIFYKDLASRVPEFLYKGKQSISNLFDVLGRHLEDKMGELDVNAYNQLLFKAPYAKTINSVDEFAQLIKLAVNQQIGSEIAGIQAIASLVDEAIEKNHADKVTPVVLSTNDEAFVLQLLFDLNRLTTRVFLLVTGDASTQLKTIDSAIVLSDATKTAVGNALKSIKKGIRK